MANSEGTWVTINGAHVLIDGKGTITKGPKSLVGKNKKDVRGAKVGDKSTPKRTNNKVNTSSRGKSATKSSISTKDKNVAKMIAKDYASKGMGVRSSLQALNRVLSGSNYSNAQKKEMNLAFMDEFNKIGEKQLKASKKK